MVARKKSERGKLSKNDEENIVQRACANQRERQRTKELNDAFTTLRRLIPSMPSDKMSKIHTLRIATDYICFLDEMKQNGCKMFGQSIFDERNGYGLQTAFNIWRSSHGLTSSNILPINNTHNSPSTSTQLPHNGITSISQQYYVPFKEYQELNDSTDSNQLTPINWS